MTPSPRRMDMKEHGMKPSSMISRRFAIIGLAATLFAAPVQGANAPAARAYEQVADWAKLPAGTSWQDMMAIDIDSKGDIYVLQRTPFQVMVFNAKGKFLRSWNMGDLPRVHGLRIDAQDNLWITDRKLHQVFKYSRDGKLLMELGTRGVAGDNDSKVALNGPADVAVGPDGTIFVADGESTNTRIVKFSKDGTFLKSWGTKGSGLGQLLIPHSIVMDARGRLLVANRGNKRIEIFDQDGTYIDQITSPATPYGLFVGPDDIIYMADGTKAPGVGGMMVLDMRSRKVLTHVTGLTGAHMVTVDRKGAIYIAQVSGKSVLKFVRKR